MPSCDLYEGDESGDFVVMAMKQVIILLRFNRVFHFLDTKPRILCGRMCTNGACKLSTVLYVCATTNSRP